MKEINHKGIQLVIPESTDDWREIALRTNAGKPHAYKLKAGNYVMVDCLLRDLKHVKVIGRDMTWECAVDLKNVKLRKAPLRGKE